MKIFLTGATGFIGQHLLSALLGRGHRVQALVRRPGLLPIGCEELLGDLLDPETYKDQLADADALIHLAALLHPVESEALAWETNHDATLELARAAAATKVEHFVFVSTVAAIGAPADSGLATRDTPCSPNTPYGASKRAAEVALLAAYSAHPRVSILRPPTVYGPGDRRNFLSLTRAVATGFFPMPGRGRNRMSFCHVSNVADALCFLVEHKEAQGIFHVADPDDTTLASAVNTIARSLGTRPLGLPFPMLLAKMAALACEAVSIPLGIQPVLSRQRLKTLTQDLALDCSAFHQLGFVPKTTFAEGVAETIAWYRKSALIT